MRKKIPKYVKELKERIVFKFKDSDAGDYKRVLCFIGEIKPARPPHPSSGLIYKIITENGYIDWMHESELIDIDPNTIRQYNSELDVDFYGMCG